MIDIMAIRALGAVSYHGSVIAAAASLGYSPSAVSQQIKKLEKQSGVALLERHGRGVLLTARGMTLAEHGRRILGDIEELETSLMADPGQPSGTLRLCAFSTACRGLIGPLLAELAEDPVPMTITVVAEDPREAIELVAAGEADLGVVHNWNSVPLVIPENIASEDLCGDTADLLVNRNHPFAALGTVDGASLVGEDWISTPVGAICHEALLRIFADLGAVPKIRVYDPDFSTHIALVELGVGVALVPRLGRPALPEAVTAVEVDNPRQVREVQMVYRKTMAGSPAIVHVARRLRRIAVTLTQ